MLLANLASVPIGVMTTLTAPGADVLPFDRAKCSHHPDVKCSGKIGCKVDEDCADEWESSLPRRWRRLMVAMRRRFDTAGLPWPYLGKVHELQRRGVSHIHIPLDYSRPEAAKFFMRLLKELGPSYGFGFADSHVKPSRGVAFANYCAGYLGGGKGEASLVGAASHASDYQRVWSCTPRLTTKTHVTARSLCNGRRLWASSLGYCKRPTEGYAIVEWNVLDLASGEVLGPVFQSREVCTAH